MFIFHRIVFIINHICILLLLASALAPFVSPVLSWHIAFLGLAFPVILFINVLFIIYWAIFLKLKFIFSLAAIIICSSYIPRFVQFNAVKTDYSTENTIRLVSFNTKYFGFFDEKGSAENAEIFFEKFDKINPDIICFQEMFNGTTMTNEFIKSFQNKYKEFHKANIKQSNWMVDNIGIMSRYPIISKGVVEHDTTSGNYTIYADIVKGKDTIRIITTHLQSIGLERKQYEAVNLLGEKIDSTEMSQVRSIASKMRSAFLKRSHQVDAIKEFMEHSPFRIILCGDFNDSPTSYSYRTLRGELKDAFMESGSGLGRTYVGPMPALRIDYVLGDASFNFYNYYAKSFDFSDHKMVSCTIKIK